MNECSYNSISTYSNKIHVTKFPCSRNKSWKQQKKYFLCIHGSNKSSSQQRAFTDYEDKTVELFATNREKKNNKTSESFPVPAESKKKSTSSSTENLLSAEENFACLTSLKTILLMKCG